jgi:lysylphosphatidylglycerol synthetase-like protein (DUF2156 family)
MTGRHRRNQHVFMGGVTLLFSNAMPVSNTRLRLVETVLPLDVIEISHLLTSRQVRRQFC